MKNKKAVEGLPLKYVIIVLVAALALAIILDVVGVVNLGISQNLGFINDTVTTNVTNITG